MRKKFFTILVCMLFISKIITITETILAGDEENPEIIDEEEDDIINYLDLYSAWFDEKEDEPDFLYAYIKFSKNKSGRILPSLSLNQSFPMLSVS